MARSTPSAASSRATALPMPRLPPVTMAVLPASSRSIRSPLSVPERVAGDADLVSLARHDLAMPARNAFAARVDRLFSADLDRHAQSSCVPSPAAHLPRALI